MSWFSLAKIPKTVCHQQTHVSVTGRWRPLAWILCIWLYWCHNWRTFPIYYRGSPARSRSSAATRNVWLLNSNCIYNFVRNCHLKWIKCKPSARKIILSLIHTIKTERDFSYHNLEFLEAMKYKITIPAVSMSWYIFLLFKLRAQKSGNYKSKLRL